MNRPGESFWYTRDVPFDWRTVEEAPIAERPVPPLPTLRAVERTRVPRLAWPLTVKWIAFSAVS